MLYSASWRNLLDSEDAPWLLFVGRSRRRRWRVYFLRVTSVRFLDRSLRALLFAFLLFCMFYLWLLPRWPGNPLVMARATLRGRYTNVSSLPKAMCAAQTSIGSTWTDVFRVIMRAASYQYGIIEPTQDQDVEPLTATCFAMYFYITVSSSGVIRVLRYI